jgi:hypothetical protein
MSVCIHLSRTTPVSEESSRTPRLAGRCCYREGSASLRQHQRCMRTTFAYSDMLGLARILVLVNRPDPPEPHP